MNLIVEQTYQWCPRCKTGMATGVVEAGQPVRRFCPACAFVFYNNPRPCAGAVVVNEQNQVLLLRRAVEPGAGLWDVPGGFMEPMEAPEDTARRELREETGLAIEIVRFLGIWPDYYQGCGFATLNHYFLAKPGPGPLQLTKENKQAGWFRMNELPETLAFQHEYAVMEAWKQETRL